MTRPNFFTGLKELQWILQHEPKAAQAETDLTIDFTEAPYLLIFTVDAEQRIVKILLRGELYDHSSGGGVEAATIIEDRKAGQITMRSSGDSDKSLFATLFEACRKLSRFIPEMGFEKLYRGLDPEQAGIMLEVKGDRLTGRVVSGKERPEMMCTTLFGGTVRCRPYMEDFMERSAVEEMDLTGKIDAAEHGDKFAMAHLAQAYLNGEEGVDADPAKAAYWFRKEAELQDAEGAFNLGLLYAKGYGVKRDFAEAADWMEKARLWGDTDAENLAAQYRAMRDNLKRAEAGDAAAMGALASGYMALGGSLDQAGPGEDYREALRWANEGARKNDCDAMWTLALAYEHGRGVKQDQAKAVEWYRKAADLGHAPSQYNLGCFYMRGDHLKKDVNKAIQLFRKSADQGYGLACRAMGRLYETGEDVKPDIEKELDYYEKACQADQTDAEFLRHVGFQYTNLLEGTKEQWIRGVEKAAYWLRKAADLGDRTATRGADLQERILQLYRDGVIPAGTSLNRCMKYASETNTKPQKAPSKAGNASAPQKIAEKPAKPTEQREKAEENKSTTRPERVSEPDKIVDRDPQDKLAAAFFDKDLSFALPAGYEVQRGTDDEGSPFYRVGTGKRIDDDGETQYAYSVTVSKITDEPADSAHITEGAIPLKGSHSAALLVRIVESTILAVKVKVHAAALLLGAASGRYLLLSTETFRASEEISCGPWAAFWNTILKAAALDGTPVSLEPITERMLLSESAQKEPAKTVSPEKKTVEATAAVGDDKAKERDAEREKQIKARKAQQEEEARRKAEEARRKAEEEKRKAEEEKRKAEEEKRKEEEARRSAEERKQLAEKERAAEEERKKDVYENALKKMTGNDPESYRRAKAAMLSLGGWRDSEAKADECTRKLEALRQAEEKAQLEARQKGERAAAERKAEEERQEKIRKAKKRDRIIVLILLLLAAAVFAFLLFTRGLPLYQYNSAVGLMNEGAYEEAAEAFAKLNGFGDSRALAEECRTLAKEEIYQQAGEWIRIGQYRNAVEKLELLDGYRDSRELLLRCLEELHRENAE